MVAPTMVWRDASRDGSINTDLDLNVNKSNGLLINGMRMLPTSCGTRRCGVHDTVNALG